MKRQRYSLAAARQNLPRLLDAVEAGAAIEVTRRGKPVAVLVAVDEFERLSEGRRTFQQSYRDFLRRNPDLAEHAVEAEEWLSGARDPDPGRDFSW